MSDLCLICGRPHGNPIRGGKVTRVTCFKRRGGPRGAYNKHAAPPPTTQDRVPPIVMKKRRTLAAKRLSRALAGWGVLSDAGR